MFSPYVQFQGCYLGKNRLAIFTEVQMIEITPPLLLTDISSTEICQESFSTFIVLLSGLDIFYFFLNYPLLCIYFLQPQNTLFQPAVFMNLPVWLNLPQKVRKYMDFLKHIPYFPHYVPGKKRISASIFSLTSAPS